MKVMILAAGRGQRMRPLTDQIPKPLIQAGGTPLIVRIIRQLQSAGYTDLVINHAWLGEQIESALGDGSAFGARIQWSAETTALETAGGIANALSLLGSEPFGVVNADICTDFAFTRLGTMADRLNREHLAANCVVVPNPPEHPEGDFGLTAQGLLNNSQDADLRVTYAGVGVYSPEMFDVISAGSPAPLAPLMRSQANKNRVGAELHDGFWSDVGTPERLEQVNQHLETSQ